MEAAGLETLDLPSDAVKAKGRSFREQGLILKVTIFYQNWFTTRFGTRSVVAFEQAFCRLHYRKSARLQYGKSAFPVLQATEAGREAWVRGYVFCTQWEVGGPDWI